MIHKIVVFGATSAIAESVLRLWAARGATLVLVARNADKLEPIATDLAIRGAKAVHRIIADLADINAHAALMAEIATAMPAPTLIFIAHGVLIPQAVMDDDLLAANANFHINASSPISLLMHSAHWLNRLSLQEPNAHFHLAVLGSVAGDVGRAKMTLYGAAKAAIDRAAMGLAGRFHRQKIHVTLIKPGYIASPMTAGLPKSPLMSSTEQTAPLILRAIERRRRVVYIPAWWRGIMFIIERLPRFILFRFNI